MAINDLVQNANDILQWYKSLGTGEKILWGAAGALGGLATGYIAKVLIGSSNGSNGYIVAGGKHYPIVQGQYVETGGVRYPIDYLNLDARSLPKISEKIELLEAHWHTRIFPKGISADFRTLLGIYNNKKYASRFQRRADTILVQMQTEIDFRWDAHPTFNYPAKK